MAVKRIPASRVRTVQPQTPAPAVNGFAWSPIYGALATTAGIGGIKFKPSAVTSVGIVPFAASKNFTVICVLAAPLASQPSTEAIRIGGADGIRLDFATTGSYLNPVTWTATGVANLAGDVIGLSGFDSNPIISIAACSPTTIDTYLAPLTGRTTTFSGVFTRSNAVSMLAPSNLNVQINGGAVEWYGVFVIPEKISDARAREIIANPWQLFAPVKADLWKPVAAGGNSQALAFTTDSVTVTAAQTVNHSQALAATLDGVAVSVNQAVTHSQSLAATTDSIAVSVAQAVTHGQLLAATLDGISATIAQTASHSQSMAVTLEGVSVSIAQSVASPTKNQSLAATLDGILVDIAQQAPPVLGGHGFQMVAFKSPLWWKQKPESLPTATADKKIKRIAVAIDTIAAQRIKQDKTVNLRDVQIQLAPLLVDMPYFDFKPLYSAVMNYRRQQEAAEQAVHNTAMRNAAHQQRIKNAAQEDDDLMCLLLSF